MAWEFPWQNDTPSILMLRSSLRNRTARQTGWRLKEKCWTKGYDSIKLSTGARLDFKIFVRGLVNVVFVDLFTGNPIQLFRFRNHLAKFWEFCVFKVIATHSRKQQIRNFSPKFSKLAKGGPELKHSTSSPNLLTAAPILWLTHIHTPPVMFLMT